MSGKAALTDGSAAVREIRIVWVVPRPAADGATTFDIDPWLVASDRARLLSYRYYHHSDRRLVPEKAIGRSRRYLSGGLSYRIPAQGSLARFFRQHQRFEAFGNNARVILRAKLARLREQPEQSGADAQHCHGLLLFPNTLFVPQGDHTRSADLSGRRTHRSRGHGNRIYVPKKPPPREAALGEEFSTCWSRSFPTRTSRPGAACKSDSAPCPTHVVYG